MNRKITKEIEVKAKIEDFAEVKRKLEALGCKFSAPQKQVDTVYFPNGIGPDDFTTGVNAIRIRKEKDKITLTLKQRQELALANLEKEVTVSSAETMAEILLLMGYYEFNTVSKVRRKCRYKAYEICLDEVEVLGNFIEVEKMSDEPSIAVQEELFTFLESLGINRKDRATKGYDILLHQKLHKD
jgi:adenylate cyclase class 2